jgi:hypothetical protein
VGLAPEADHAVAAAATLDIDRRSVEEHADDVNAAAVPVAR